MGFWIHAQDGASVLEHHSGGMAEVLSRLSVHDELPARLSREVELRDRVGRRHGRAGADDRQQGERGEDND